MNKIATRVAYGQVLAELGKEREDIVALDADLSCCTMSGTFGSENPERFFNVGIAEANMVGMGAGLAAMGKTAFVHSFAMFVAGRAYEQVRNSVCYPNLNVKVVGSHGGISVGEDGATHQCIEDIALMRAIPNMTVVQPCDAYETAFATKTIAEHYGPCYLRLGRLPVETVTDRDDYQFELGKGIVMRQGTDVTIIATGLMVQEALKAAELLEKEGISARIVNMHTIKPLDRELVLKCARETGAIVTSEEHNILGGMGAAVAEVICEEYPVPVIRNGVQDVFGKSGAPYALLDRYHLMAKDICECCKKAVSLKK